MKIGFFGDSWIAFNPAHLEKFPNTEWAWPNLVGTNFNRNHLYTGLGGTHLYYAYQQLIKYIDNIDFVILAVSDYERVPNEFGIDTMCPCEYSEKRVNSYFGDSDTEQYRHFKSYIENYCRHYPTFMARVAQKGLLLEIDELLGKKNKRALIIPGFEDSLCEYSFNNAAYLDISLHEIKSLDQRKNIPSYKLNKMYREGTITVLNHLLERENREIGKRVAEIIKSKFSPGKKEFKKYFNYLFN